MRVDHVLENADDPSSGVAAFVLGLAGALDKRGIAKHIHALTVRDRPVENAGIMRYGRSRLLPLGGISPQMRSALDAVAEQADVVHVHGLWTMPSVYGARTGQGNRCRTLLSPHGMLEPWALDWSKYRKMAFWQLMHKRSMKGVSMVHATSEQEADHIRRFGIDSPIEIVPPGIELPELHPDIRPNRPRTLLYLSRIHPKKNLESLLAAWKQVSQRHTDWVLRVAGGGPPRYSKMLASAADTARNGSVVFTGSLHGTAKDNEFRSADLFVLPSHSENFGIVIAEALSYGVPVIATKGTPWSIVEQAGAGWWVDASVDCLTNALDEALGMDERDLAAMGRNGRSLAEEQFSWDHVAGRMLAVYESLAAGKPASS